MQGIIESRVAITRPNRAIFDVIKSRKVIFLILIALIALFSIWYFFSPKKGVTTYQTEKAQKGTLVTSVTASGSITGGNSIAISADATGVVKTVYVKNGDSVTEGQKIAEITLDAASLQKQTSLYASYLNAIKSQQDATQNKLSLQAQLDQNKKAVIDAQNAVNTMQTDPANPQTHQPYTDLEKQSINQALTIAQDNLNLTQTKYNQADSAINAANASLTSANLAYQAITSFITAPASGVINGLSLQVGLPITNSSSSSQSSSSQNASQTSTSQKLGSITISGPVQVVVNLSEIDASKVQAAQKATITIDALPGKTFTGKVLSVDTNGSVNSGVTTYPATISLDTAVTSIYPNMTATATIITDMKDNVLLVPSSAVTTTNGSSTVKVMKNGVPTPTSIEIGESSDTQTEISSGINEGDEVVTATITSGGTSSSQGSSIFGSRTGFGAAFGGNNRGGFGGGTARRGN